MSEKRNREMAGSINDDDDEIPEFQPGKLKTSTDESRNTEDELLPSATQQGDKMDQELGSIITRFSSLDGQHLGHKVGISLVVILLSFFLWLQLFHSFHHLLPYSMHDCRSMCH